MVCCREEYPIAIQAEMRIDRTNQVLSKNVVFTGGIKGDAWESAESP
ncbi:hypothetical protein [Microcoleus vaginatus]